MICRDIVPVESSELIAIAMAAVIVVMQSGYYQALIIFGCSVVVHVFHFPVRVAR